MKSQLVLCMISLNIYNSGTRRDIEKWLMRIFLIFNAYPFESKLPAFLYENVKSIIFSLTNILEPRTFFQNRIEQNTENFTKMLKRGKNPPSRN